MTADEIVPGVFRIESDLGPRAMAQYLLLGADLSVLIDTGISTTPETVLEPFLTGIGLPDGPDLVLISHADVDHCGGNAAFRLRFPRTRFACHELDRDWISHNDAMLGGNYRWYERYGLGPTPDDLAFITRELGGDAPIDLGLTGGEVIHLAENWDVHVLSLPGHTAGHVGIWDPRSRSALIIDAVLERGVRDRDGTLSIPPRVYDVDAYRGTIASVRSLDPERLLTGHFAPLVGSAVTRFLDASLEHDLAVEAAVRDALRSDHEDLHTLTAFVDERLGPYAVSGFELAAAVRDHAQRLGTTVV